MMTVRTRLSACLVVILLICAWPVPAWAQLGTVPFTFTAGTVITSAQVNTNFSTAYANALNRTGGAMTGTLTTLAVLPTTDNASDIGSAALSYNDGWFDGTLTTVTSNVTGIFTVSGFGAHTFSASGTGGNGIRVRNTTVGTGNYSEIRLGNDTAVGTFDLYATSTTYTPSGPLLADAGVVYTAGAGGLSLAAAHASGDVRIYNRGAVLALTFGASQAATFTGTVRMSAYGAGTATFDASGNITSVSDERQKDIVGAFTPGLNALMGVRPILYRYKASTGLDTDNIYAGFSAQNVRDYIPEAIGKNVQGMYSLNIVPVLAASVTAIQELTREVDELRALLKLPAKVRSAAPVPTDARVVTSPTPARLAEIAKVRATCEAENLARTKRGLAPVGCQ